MGLADEASQLFDEGKAALQRFDLAAALEAFTKALPLYRQVGDVLGEANCLLSLASIAFGRSEPDAARRGYEEALALYREVGDVPGEANCTFGLSHIRLLGTDPDPDAARRGYEEALALYRQVDDKDGESWCMERLSTLDYADALPGINYATVLKAQEEGFVIPFPIRLGYTHKVPPSKSAAIRRRSRMGDDLNTAVKKTKAETLARGKPRMSTVRQLANYKALIQHVDLLNPELPEDERLRRARRLVRAYERVRERRPKFHDHCKQLLAAFSIVNKVKYPGRKRRKAKPAQTALAV